MAGSMVAQNSQVSHRDFKILKHVTSLGLPDPPHDPATTGSTKGIRSLQVSHTLMRFVSILNGQHPYNSNH